MSDTYSTLYNLAKEARMAFFIDEDKTKRKIYVLIDQGTGNVKNFYSREQAVGFLRGMAKFRASVGGE